MDDASLQKLFSLIRYYILTITTHAGSGHPTSSLSAVELMTVLFFKYLRYDLTNPKHAGNDRVIFSKGHASPLYYALYAAGGVLSEKDLAGYRTFDSVLEGHPTERFKYTEAATGSLGQGLSIGLGEALALKLQQETRNKELDKNKPQVSSIFCSPCLRSCRRW
jgi:transketolase